MAKTYLITILLLLVAVCASASNNVENICSQNQTIGTAVVKSLNLSWPGLELAKQAVARGDLGDACEEIATYYRKSNGASWLRIPPVKPGNGLVGGSVDAMVFHDVFSGFPSPSRPCKIGRNADGGLNWTTYGPDDDDEFMNVLNRHEYFTTLLSAWNETGNGVYVKYFDALVQDWVTHLPCNNAKTSLNELENNEKSGCDDCCVPLGTMDTHGLPFCKWDTKTAGGECSTGTFESPWRSLEMGIRLVSAWPKAFYGFQQSDNFTTNGRVLLILAVAEHFKALQVDGGHPGKGTVNWEMTQWQGLLSGAGAWPEIIGSAEAAQTATHFLQALLDSGVYDDGVENEMASGYDIGTASDYIGSLEIIKRAGLPAPPEAYAKKIENMWNYGAYVADPLGCLPQNGDSDICGNGHSFENSAFFNRTDWDYVYTNGKQGTPPTGPDHVTPSVMFPWAGQAVLRSSYLSNATWCWFDVGPFGSNAFHAHKDKLSILLNAYESMLLTDSGRFAYAGNSFSHFRRPYGHETHAHNTLRIDGKQQAQAPALATAPRPTTSWSYETERDIVQGSMPLWDGLQGQAKHCRSIYHQRGKWIVVVDVVSSDRDERAVQATWHGHPNATINISSAEDGMITTIRGVNHATGMPTSAHLAIIPASMNGISPSLATKWDNATVVRGQLQGKDGAIEDQGWYSAHYSDASAAPVAVYASIIYIYIYITYTRLSFYVYS
eukprot:m.88716 g.88716  ORF g.88716 m.88716 type:complete len:721 (-) comp13184_c0_seq1:32-2194(-)